MSLFFVHPMSPITPQNPYPGPSTEGVYQRFKTRYSIYSSLSYKRLQLSTQVLVTQVLTGHRLPIHEHFSPLSCIIKQFSSLYSPSSLPSLSQDSLWMMGPLRPNVPMVDTIVTPHPQTSNPVAPATVSGIVSVSALVFKFYQSATTY